MEGRSSAARRVVEADDSNVGDKREGPSRPAESPAARSGHAIAPGAFEIGLRQDRVHLIVEEALTLIDAGLPGSSRAIDRAIKTLGRSPTRCARSSAPPAIFDHAGGAAELAARGDVLVIHTMSRCVAPGDPSRGDVETVFGDLVMVDADTPAVDATARLRQAVLAP